MRPPENFDPFQQFFDNNPDLFKPLDRNAPMSSNEYEPKDEIEAQLLVITNRQADDITQKVIDGELNISEVFATLGKTLVVYPEDLGFSLGNQLEGKLRVGISTSIQLPNELDPSHILNIAITSEGELDIVISRLGIIIPEILNESDKEFINTHYFPLDKVQEILNSLNK